MKLIKGGGGGEGEVIRLNIGRSIPEFGISYARIGEGAGEEEEEKQARATIKISFINRCVGMAMFFMNEREELLYCAGPTTSHVDDDGVVVVDMDGWRYTIK